jgi:hypothetical protein
MKPFGDGEVEERLDSGYTSQVTEDLRISMKNRFYRLMPGQELVWKDEVAKQ